LVFSNARETRGDPANGRTVLGVCRRVLHDEHLAEDAFQATFLILARKAASIRKQQSVGSWLHGVALRLSRKSKSEAVRSKRPDARGKSQAAVDPQAKASWHESQEILDDELQRLPEKYRLPLILCYLEGLTRDEAAVQLGWTASKLKGLLERGRDQLRSQLVRRGVTLSAAGAATLLTDTILSASVPPLLAVSTVHAAALAAAGTALTSCGISASVVALTEGGMTMMASKKMTLILVLALVLGVIGSGVNIWSQQLDPTPAGVNAGGGKAPAEGEKPGSSPQQPLSVSLLQLIATPDAFDGKHVQIFGFVRIEHEGTSIYLHREDSDHRLHKNGLWLVASDVPAEDSKEALVKDRYALIEGRFTAKRKGHRDLWSGSIEEIIRMEPWEIRKAKK
jgi:RNA polymerase sigma factor (sigma-70 family)